MPVHGPCFKMCTHLFLACTGDDSFGSIFTATSSLPLPLHTSTSEQTVRIEGRRKAFPSLIGLLIGQGGQGGSKPSCVIQPGTEEQRRTSTLFIFFTEEKQDMESSCDKSTLTALLVTADPPLHIPSHTLSLCMIIIRCQNALGFGSQIGFYVHIGWKLHLYHLLCKVIF